MKKCILFFLFFIACVHLWAQRPFIAQWLPTQNIITNNYEIKIVTDTSLYHYNYNITWENMTIPGLGNGSATNVTGNLLIILPYNFYKISITGVFPYIRTNTENVWSIEQWGDIQWRSFYFSFASHQNLLLNATDLPDLSNVTSLESMFSGCALFTGNSNMNNWNTEHVQNMRNMFSSCKKFNQNINNWNTANVTNMSFMFARCEDFNQPLNNWNTGNVTNMSSMFDECTNFNQPIGNWNVSKVTNMSWMFEECTNFNQPIGNWDVGNVENIGGIFYYAASFNQPINNWNTSNVIEMYLVFPGSNFDLPIENWNVSNVINMSTIFGDKLNQPVGNWNTSNLEVINYFSGLNFNQNLGDWNVSNLKFALGAFDGNSMSMDNYDSTLIGWSSQNLRDSVTLGAMNKQYCNSVTERKSMIINHHWNFVGDIQSCLTEVKESIESPQISLYPNPNRGNFVIQSIKNDHYEIYDIHGKQISSGKILSGKNNIQVSLASGLYVIKLVGQQKNIKMVIE